MECEHIMQMDADQSHIRIKEYKPMESCYYSEMPNIVISPVTKWNIFR